MNISKRQQRRIEYLEKNKERIEKLVEKYGDSRKIQEKIKEIENKGSNGGELSGKDVKELEVLNSQYRVLREHERNNKDGDSNNRCIVKDRVEDKEDKENTKDGIKVLSLKERSVFWDAELNPLGRQPFEECQVNYSFKGGYVIPFRSNIEEEEIGKIAYPLEDKPRFYRNHENRTVYEG